MALRPLLRLKKIIDNRLNLPNINIERLSSSIAEKKGKKIKLSVD